MEASNGYSLRASTARIHASTTSLPILPSATAPYIQVAYPPSMASRVMTSIRTGNLSTARRIPSWHPWAYPMARVGKCPLATSSRPPLLTSYALLRTSGQRPLALPSRTEPLSSPLVIRQTVLIGLMTPRGTSSQVPTIVQSFPIG